MASTVTKGTKRTLEDADPDYDNYVDITAQQNKKQRLIEQTAKEASEKTIRGIIQRTFEQEEAIIKREIMDLDEQVVECRHELERIRIDTLTKYYQRGVEPSGADAPVIHPTVKQHLGKAPKGIPKSSVAADTKTQIKQETKVSQKVDQGKPVDGAQRVGRYKSKKTIIVGNVSKFIAPEKRDENDQATHKWMVYVRGPKDQPDISDFISKVWFFLHPSYKPNDLVEVSQPPFSLTRRGWGEFPIRVQLYFHDSRNKTVDIIHAIKLDRTYTGLQTLGAETTVPIELERDKRESSPKSLAHNIPKQVIENTTSASAPVEKSLLNGNPQSLSSAKDQSLSRSEATIDAPLKEEDTQVKDGKTVPQNTLSSPLKEQTDKETSNLTVPEKNVPDVSVSKSVSSKVSAAPTSVYSIIVPTTQIASSSSSTLSNSQILAVQKLIPQQQKISSTLLGVQIKGDKTKPLQVLASPPSLGALSPRGITRMQQPRVSLSPPQVIVPSPKRVAGNVPCQLAGQSIVSLAASPTAGSGRGAATRNPAPLIPGAQVVARAQSGQIFYLLPTPSTQVLRGPARLPTSSLSSVTVGNRILSTRPSTLTVVPKQPGVQRFTLPPTTLLKQQTVQQASSAIPKQLNVGQSVSLRPQAVSVLRHPIPTLQSATQPSTSVLTQQTLINPQQSPQSSAKKQIAHLSTSVLKPQSLIDAQKSTQATSVLKQQTPQPILLKPGVKGPQTLLLPSGSKGAQTLLLQAPGTVTPSVPRGTQATGISLLRPISSVSAPAVTAKKQISLLTGKTLISTVDKTGVPTIIPPTSSTRTPEASPLPSPSTTNQCTASEPPKRLLGIGVEKPRTVVMKNNSTQLVAKIVPRDTSLSNFENMEAIVRFVARYHPLIGSSNIDRSQHPYCAPSVETYLGWNIAKRRAYEWCRASAMRRDVVHILGGDTEFCEEKVWSRRDIVLWCRYHMYTPMDDEIKSRLYKSSSTWFGDYTSLSEPVLEIVPSANHSLEEDSDEDIDVQSDGAKKSCLSPYKQRVEEEEKRQKGTIVPPTTEADFVTKVAKQIGVDLAPAELVPTVYGHTAAQMIWTVYEKLLEDILRKSCSVRYQNNAIPEELSVNEVYRAIMGIPVCDFLTNKGLGVRPICSTVQDIEK